MKKVQVIDGVPIRLRGVRQGAKSVVQFIHKCCKCGLRHDVKVVHDGKTPIVDMSFDRKDT